MTGAGQRTFTVGADISDDLSAGTEVARVVNHALLNAYSKLIVAAVNGDCIGGGFELLLSTDIRAAVPEARFGLPEGGDLSVRRPGTAPIRSRIAAHCAYGDCLGRMCPAAVDDIESVDLARPGTRRNDEQDHAEEQALHSCLCGRGPPPAC